MDFSKRKFDIIVVAGQSNAEGNGVSTSDTKYVNENIFQCSDKHPCFIDANDPKNPHVVGTLPVEAEIIPLQERNDDKPFAYSFDITFAEKYVESGLLKEGRDLIVIRTAIGGSGFALNQQGVNNFIHKRCLDMVNYVLNLNKDNRIVAYLWHQGEHDAWENLSMSDEERYNFYHEKFMEQTKDFINKYKQFKFPVISGEFCNEWADLSEVVKQTKTIERCLKDCMNELGYAAMVSSEGLLSNNQEIHNGDNIHFSKNSCKLLGNRYFEEYVKLISK